MLLDVNVEGANILIDGEPIGVSPLPPNGWWLDAGEHVVGVNRDGYADETQKAVIAAGQSVRLSFALKPLIRSSEPNSAISASSPVKFQIASAALPDGELDTVPLPADKGTPSSARTLAVVTGATLTAIAAGLGGYFLVKRGADRDHAAEMHNTVVIAMGTNGCALPSQSGSALCGQLSDSYDIVDKDKKLAITSFGVAGALSLATVATLLLWPRTHRSVQVGPAGRGLGIAVTGVFE